MKKERKRKTRETLRFTALLLTLAVSLTLFPVSGADSAAPEEAVSTEVLSLREENVEHFAVGNNTYQAVAYGHPVHHLAENGNWVDIDNSLTLSGGSYATEDGRVSFVQSFVPNQNLLTLQEGGTSVSMALLAELSNQMTAQPMSLAVVSNPQNSILTAEDAMNAVFSSSVTYENVLPDTDLEYTVDASSVKEYIVVNEPQTSYAYHFALTLSGLTAQLEEDGSVGLYTAEDERKYTIPAPYMFDAAGSFSEAVAYTLQGANGKYFLTVTADAQWLNDPARVWPVKIDPTIVDSTDSATGAYISSEHGNATFMNPSYLNVSNTAIAYVKTPDISVGDGMVLDWAYLTLFYYFPESVTSGSISISASPVLVDWVNNADGWTWNVASDYANMGMDSAAIAAKTITYSSSATYSSPVQTDFNITTQAKKWFIGTDDFGFAIQRTGGTSDSIRFRHSSTTGFSYRPRVSYQYRPGYGIMNYYDESLGDVGIAQISSVIGEVSAAYSHQFGIAVREINTPEESFLLTAGCLSENDPFESSCDIHHRDYIWISDKLMEEYDEVNYPSNTRIVFWTNPEDIGGEYYCDHYGGNHEVPLYNIYGLVVAFRPVIHILDLIIPASASEDAYRACMGYILIHEFAHTFGFADEDVSHTGDEICCMNYFDVVDDDFVTNYERIKNGEADAFCSSCSAQIQALITADMEGI